MGLLDKLKGELIDIIEWTDDSSDLMVYRFERHDNEIKNGAKLVVRESQEAVFVDQGKIADIFKSGMYELKTENMPVLSTLKGWKYGFHSPFKAEVYFVNTKLFTDLKWGTQNPIMMRDAEFGPVRLRAFGSFETRVADAATFAKNIFGTNAAFSIDEITDQLRNIIASRFADALGESKIPALDLAANYDELGNALKSKIEAEFTKYGLELTKMLVENISLPPAVEEAMDKRTSMGVIGNMQQYTQFQTANAIEDAAKNEGNNMAAGGMGMGMGFAMGNQMGNAMAPNQGGQQQPAGGPPPLNQATFFVAVNGQQTGPFDINTIKTKIQGGEITQDTQMWKQGMPNWVVAKDLAEVTPLFGAVPPPVPDS